MCNILHFAEISYVFCFHLCRCLNNLYTYIFCVVCLYISVCVCVCVCMWCVCVVYVCVCVMCRLSMWGRRGQGWVPRWSSTLSRRLNCSDARWGCGFVTTTSLTTSQERSVYTLTHNTPAHIEENITAVYNDYSKSHEIMSTFLNLALHSLPTHDIRIYLSIVMSTVKALNTFIMCSSLVVNPRRACARGLR